MVAVAWCRAMHLLHVHTTQRRRGTLRVDVSHTRGETREREATSNLNSALVVTNVGVGVAQQGGGVQAAVIEGGNRGHGGEVDVASDISEATDHLDGATRPELRPV